MENLMKNMNIKIIYLKFNDYHKIALCYYSTVINNHRHISICLKKIIIYRHYLDNNIEHINPHVSCLWFDQIKNLNEIKQFIYTESTLTSISYLLKT
jgi:hypothetical protein